MNKKRFTIDFEGFIYDNEEVVEDIVVLLNSLNDENEQLKSELAKIKRQEQEVIEYLRAYHKGDVKELKE